MQTPHYVVGHRNPDTDSIASAHVLAWMINEDPNEHGPALAIRLGEPNPQTAWLFEQAKVDLPELKLDCRIRVGDIATESLSVSSTAPISEALQLLRRNESNLVGVVDGNKELMGVIGIRTPRVNQLLSSGVSDYGSSLLDINILKQGLDLQEIRPCLPFQSTERLYVAASSDERLEKEIQCGDIVICGLHPKCLEIAERNNASAVICCTNQLRKIGDTIDSTSVPIYHYQGSIIKLVGQLPDCVPCWTVMEEVYETIDADTILSDSRKGLSGSPDGLIVFSDDKWIGTLHQHQLLDPPRPKLSLVDHFEKAQSIDGFEEADLVKIIDHHRIGDIETDGPVEIDCRQWGSTASILYSRLEMMRITPPRDIALLLLGAIQSDTIGLRSPTCTDYERSLVEKLAMISKVDLDKFTNELLRQNDQVQTVAPIKLLEQDCKPFHHGDTQFLVSQIETMDLDGISEVREFEITEAFQQLVECRGVDFGVIMITDILKQTSLIKLVSNHEKWQRLIVPDQPLESNSRWLAEDWVSRKRQVIPFIMKRLRAA